MKRQDKRLVAFVVGAIMGLLIFLLIFLRCDTKEDFIAQPYTVRYGDCLDKLYYEFAGTGNLEKWRYEVKKLNDMEESGLYEGEEIVILVHKDDAQWK